MQSPAPDPVADRTRHRLRSAFVNQPWNPAIPPVEEGSVAIWTYQVARALSAASEVAVVSRQVRDRGNHCRHDGVEYLRVAASPEPFGPIARLQALRSSNSIPRFATQRYYRAYFRRAARRLARWSPDVVHVHNLFQALPALRSMLPDTRLVLHMHCEWLSQLPREYVRRFLQVADGVATCSDHVRQTLAEALPEWGDRSTTLPNGVDTSVFSVDSRQLADSKGRVILFVGRVSPEKGLHVLMDAFRLVAERFEDATLLVVGPDAATPAEFLVDLSTEPMVRSLRRFYGVGTYAGALRQVLPDQIAARVSFRGAVAHADLPTLYRSAAVLVNPSLSESFGMSVIEAMACGCPVVVAGTGGMRSLVEHEVNGLVVPPNDAAELAASLSRLLADRALGHRCAAVGRARVVELYDWSTVSARTLEFHRRLARGSE